MRETERERERKERVVSFDPFESWVECQFSTRFDPVRIGFLSPSLSHLLPTLSLFLSHYVFFGEKEKVRSSDSELEKRRKSHLFTLNPFNRKHHVLGVTKEEHTLTLSLSQSVKGRNQERCNFSNKMQNKERKKEKKKEKKKKEGRREA